MNKKLELKRVVVKMKSLRRGPSDALGQSNAKRARPSPHGWMAGPTHKSNSAIVYNRVIDAAGHRSLSPPVNSPYETERGPLRGEMVFVKGRAPKCGADRVAALCRLSEVVKTSGFDEFVRGWRLDGVLRTFDAVQAHDSSDACVFPAPRSSGIVVVVQGPFVVQNVFTKCPTVMDTCWIGLLRRDSVLRLVPFTSLDVHETRSRAAGQLPLKECAIRDGDDLLSAWRVGKIIDVCPAPDELTVNVNIAFFTRAQLEVHFGAHPVFKLAAALGTFANIAIIAQLLSMTGALSTSKPVTNNLQVLSATLTSHENAVLEGRATQAEQVAAIVLRIYKSIAALTTPTVSDEERRSLVDFASMALTCAVEFPDMWRGIDGTLGVLSNTGALGHLSRINLVRVLLDMFATL